MSKLEDFYIKIIYFATIFSLLVSSGYFFRGTRGEYGKFYLNDNNYLVFYFGIISISYFFAYLAIRLMGSVAFSFSEIFWRFSGGDGIPKNFLYSKFTWALVIIWLLSTSWLSMAILGATAFEILVYMPFYFFLIINLFLGVLGTQISRNRFLLDAASTILLAAGFFTVLYGSSNSIDPNSENCLLYVNISAIFIISLLSFISYIKNKKGFVDNEYSNSSYANRIILVNSILNFTSSDGFKFYNSRKNILRIDYKPVGIAKISILSAVNSPFFFLFAFIITIPVCILLGVSFGSYGIVVFMFLGILILSNVYRWMAREWSQEVGLRRWLGGKYLKQLILYSIGPTIISTFYCIGIVLIFSLPFKSVLLGCIFGLIVALGRADPGKEVKYDLVVITPDGIVIQVHHLKTLLYLISLVLIHVLCSLSSSFISIMFPFIAMIFLIYHHWKFSTNN